MTTARETRPGSGYHLTEIPAGSSTLDIYVPGSSTESQHPMSDIDIKDAPTQAGNSSIGDKPVLFYGKPAQLDSFIAYLTIQFIVRDTPDTRKVAVTASLFRGPALVWITTKIQKNPTVLSSTSWEDFHAQLQANYGLSDEARTSLAAKKLANLRQTSSVQAYAAEFQEHAATTGINGPTSTALFIKGLKPTIRNALIISDSRDSLRDAIDEAKRIDEQFFYARGANPNRDRASYPGSKPGRNKRGQWVKKESSY